VSSLSAITASRKRGFTIAELMITMAVTLVLAILLLGIYKSSIRSYFSGNSQIDIQKKVRFSQLEITNLLRCAVPPDAEHSAISSLSANSISFYVSRAALGGPARDPGNPIFDRITIRFDDSEKKVMVDGLPYGSQISSELCCGINDLTFAWKSSPNIVQFSLWVAGTKPSGEETSEKEHTFVVQIPYYSITQ